MSNSGPKPTSDNVFDVKRVRQLVELMQEFELSEVDLKDGIQRVRLRRGAEPVLVTASAPVATAPAASAPATSAAPAAAPAPSKFLEIKSPMVGTFYTAANPESPPFVKVGDMIGKDSTVCIIEAMKVFNQIPAEVAGKIAAVLVENGQPVEFGQPLFKVDPS
jgi:acetyl-CoA carboxylase biotin carboxyl carrier protein